MLATLLTVLSTAIGVYITLVIIWAIVSTLVSFNILNRHQPLTARVLYGLDRIVQPALRPIQRIMPDMGGLDLSPIVLIFLLTFLKEFVYGLVDTRFALIAFINLINAFLVLYIYCVAIYATLGLLINFKLVNPYQTLVNIVMNILRKLVNPPVTRIRRFVPPIGKIDFAPWILLALLMLAKVALYRLFVY